MLSAVFVFSLDAVRYIYLGELSSLFSTREAQEQQESMLTLFDAEWSINDKYSVSTIQYRSLIQQSDYIMVALVR